MIKKLFALLVFLCLVGIAGAATISTQPVTISSVPGTGTSQVILNTAPNGYSGSHILVSVANTSVATIAGVSYPAWCILHTDSTDGYTVSISEADVNAVYEDGSTNIVLATINLNGVAAGTTQLQVSIVECDDDDGFDMGASTSNGTVTVSGSATPTPTPTTTPTTIPTTIPPGSNLIIGQSVMIPTVSGTATSNIVLSSAPQGLAGYNMVVTIANPSVATISSVSYDTWCVLHADTSPGNPITISGADLNSLKQDGSTNIILATVHITGLSAGTTQLQITSADCDDDDGSPISASLGTSTIVIAPPASPTPTPTVAPPEGSCHTDPPTDVTPGGAILCGHTDTNATVWFEYGMISGSENYQYSTGHVEVPAGSDFNETVSGYPFIAGYTYYYVVNSSDGQHGSEQSFTLPYTEPVPTTTFGDYFGTFNKAHWNITEAGLTIFQPYTDLMGPIFWGMFWLFIFMAIWGRTGAITLPCLLGIAIGAIILPFLPPEFQKFAYSMMVVALTGLIYGIVVKR
jgi:hypothetical protein